MYPFRRSLIPVILAGALFAPEAHAAQTPGAGPGHAPVLRLATVPPCTRIRRGRRRGKLRTIAWWRRPEPAIAATGHTAGASFRPQLSSNDTSARGPPPLPVINSWARMGRQRPVPSRPACPPRKPRRKVSMFFRPVHQAPLAVVAAAMAIGAGAAGVISTTANRGSAATAAASHGSASWGARWPAAGDQRWLGRPRGEHPARS